MKRSAVLVLAGEEQKTEKRGHSRKMASSTGMRCPKQTLPPRPLRAVPRRIMP